MSGGAFLSPSWYRVAGLRPLVKSQAQLRRHRFRGAVWYVIQDPASGRFNRVTPAAYQLLGLMDGRRSMDEVWVLAVEQLGDETPSQEEVISLLAQLHAADLLYCEVNPDTAELFERFSRQVKARGRSNWKNPFSIRIPLWNPDRFLERSMWLLRPLRHWTGVFLYCLVVGYALLLAGLNWPELSGNFSDRLLSVQNMVVLWLCFPVVKLLHELGHAYAVKAGGGEVHEMGVMFLVFMPIPYVDASAASGFRSRRQRVLVGAAGMLTELFVAALFMFVWVAAEPGLLRALAFKVMLIAGLSTVVFNGNPLLRFDAYYILSDLIEMPNLASRGTKYWRYLAERYAFRMPHAESAPLSAGERRWLLFYTPAAFLYRSFVLIAIVLYIAGQWFFIGVALAIYGVTTMFAWPVMKLFSYLLALPRSAGSRRRAMTISACALATVLVLVAAVPAPMSIKVEGVVWLPEEANVRAGTDGFVRRILVQPGAQVRAGEPLIESDDPVLRAERRVSEWRLAELRASLDAQRFADRVAAQQTRKQIDSESVRHDRLVEREAQLVARSAVDGRFVLERPEDTPGRFFHQGQSLGYVTQEARTIVRIVVSQNDVDLVRKRLRSIEVRLREQIEHSIPARLVREVPAAADQLPSTALSSTGGGEIAADPRDPHGGKTLQRMFQFDLELASRVALENFGGRAYVRLAMQPEPIARQVSRRLRQLFLERFNV